MTLHIRRFRTRDSDALGQLYFRAVHEGAAGAYDAAERKAWAPDVPSGAEWSLRLGRSVTFVAERRGVAVGFMTFVPETGYIDLAFVAPEVMGQGVAHELYGAVEQAARAAGHSEMTTAASLVARPFFERQGWEVREREDVSRGGAVLTRFQMAKRLG